MDPQTLATGIGLFGSAIAAIKQAIELLPDDSKKTAATEALQRAERELKIAEAQAAKELGYEVCREHFPPEIMLSPDNYQWKCPKCGNQKNTRIDWDPGPTTPSRWDIENKMFRVPGYYCRTLPTTFTGLVQVHSPIGNMVAWPNVH